MKIVIAPDSYKDSLSAVAAAQAIARGWRSVFSQAQTVECPMADGGEGTIEAILAAVPGEWRTAQVSGPLGEPTSARWGWLPDSRTAIIEMAEASGLQLVPLAQRDARISSTRGTGELILQALDAGARTLILTIGGSATNDAGSGLLSALGARLLDASSAALAPGGLALAQLARIDITNLDPRLADIQVVVAADVNNPLCGPHGASHIFGPQKGATAEHVLSLDAALGHFADACANLLGKDLRNVPGAGAAGGLGFAAMAFLGATFRPGVEVVAEQVSLADKVQDADLVITGEGCFDSQTLRGKTPLGVARVAQRHGVPVIVLAGTLGQGYDALYDAGIQAAFSLTSGPMSLEEACRRAPQLLEERARDIARLWQLGAGRAL